MAVGKSGGARTMSAAKTPDAEESDRQKASSTPKRPRLREGEAKGAGSASSPSRPGTVSNTPTRELRRQAAQEVQLQAGSSAQNSPRSEPLRAPDSPSFQSSPKGKKRPALEDEPGETKRGKKKLRVESGAAATSTPPKAVSSPREIKVFRSLTASGLRGLLRKDKTPSSEDLRSDPDEDYTPREARLPSVGSSIFSRGAVPTTVLDSTTEEAPQRPQGARAPEDATENV